MVRAAVQADGVARGWRAVSAAGSTIRRLSFAAFEGFAYVFWVGFRDSIRVLGVKSFGNSAEAVLDYDVACRLHLGGAR
jgi:hypothetical protein